MATEMKDKIIRGATPFIERRYIPIDSEFRFDTNKNELEGYASVFDEPYEVCGFWETVLRGTFKKTIKQNDIRSLYNHDPNYVLGRNKAQPAATLEINEDAHGLHYRTKLPNTTFANDLRESIARGDVSQCSIGFQVVKDIWEDNFKKRTLSEAKLFDVGPVTFPASTSTEVKLRSAMLDMGIDYNTLNLIIIKANREISLEESDLNLLRSTIEILNDYLPRDEVPPVDEHTPDVEPDQSILLGKMLERKNQVRLMLGGI